MSEQSLNIFNSKNFRKVSVKIFDRFQFTLANKSLIDRIQNALLTYFQDRKNNHKFKFEDLLLQEQYEDDFNEFNDLVQESREDSFEEFFEVILSDLNINQDFQKTLRKLCSNSSMQNFLRTINIYYIEQLAKTFDEKIYNQQNKSLQECLQEHLKTIQQNFSNIFFHNNSNENFNEHYKKNKKASQTSFNRSSSKYFDFQENKAKTFVMKIQDQIQKLNEDNLFQQKQLLQLEFEEFFRNNQQISQDQSDQQREIYMSNFDGFLPFENVYNLQKSGGGEKRQSQIFVVEQVQYDQSEENDQYQSSDSQKTFSSNQQLYDNKFMHLKDLVDFCQQLQQHSLQDEKIQQQMLNQINAIQKQSQQNHSQKLQIILKNKFEEFKSNQQNKLQDLGRKIQTIFQKFQNYVTKSKQIGFQNLKNQENNISISQDLNTKYQKLEEENKSLRLILKTYEDIKQSNKDEESFELKEDKSNEKQFFSNDYYGYGEGQLEAVQEENSQYESYESKSNALQTKNKKFKPRKIQTNYEYIQEKQIDLFKDNSVSKKKMIYSTQKSQKSIFDHENILNQLDFEHRRYSKRSISLPRLASKKIKKSIKKISLTARVFKFNVKLEKALQLLKKVNKKEQKLKLNVNRLVNSIKLHCMNNKQFADYVSEDQYFNDDNAFQNNLEIQMEYTKDNSVRFQNRKSTTKTNQRDSLRVNNQRFSTQPNGTFFQLEEQNKSLQKHIQELNEILELEKKKNFELLQNLNSILNNNLDYEDTQPNDVIESMNIIVDRIEQLKNFVFEQQDKHNNQEQINPNVLVVLQDQILTCENLQKNNCENLRYILEYTKDPKMEELLENQLDLSDDLFLKIQKISNILQNSENLRQKTDKINQKDLHIENMYEGEENQNSDQNSYDSDVMEQFEKNINTENFDDLRNQSQPSLLEEDENLKTEREKPTREDQEVYKKNILHKKTTSQMGTSRISSDYDLQNPNKSQLMTNLEENINSILQILQVIKQEENVDIMMDLAEKFQQQLQYNEEFSCTKIPVQQQKSIQDQNVSRRIVELENEV